MSSSITIRQVLERFPAAQLAVARTYASQEVVELFEGLVNRSEGKSVEEILANLPGFEGVDPAALEAEVTLARLNVLVDTLARTLSRRSASPAEFEYTLRLLNDPDMRREFALALWRGPQ